MASVPDSTSTSNEVRSLTATVRVGEDTLTVDSATPGSAIWANGVRIGIPERLRQDALDEVARRLSLTKVPQGPVTSNTQPVTDTQAIQRPVSQLQTQNHAMRAHAHGGSLDTAGYGSAQMAPPPPAAAAAVAASVPKVTPRSMGVFRAGGTATAPHDLSASHFSPTGAIDLDLDEIRSSWSTAKQYVDLTMDQQQLIHRVSTCMPQSSNADVDHDKAHELLHYVIQEGVSQGHFSGDDVRHMISAERGLLSLDNARQQAIVSLLRDLQANHQRRADVDQAQDDLHSAGLPLAQYAKAVIDLSSNGKQLAARIVLSQMDRFVCPNNSPTN